jgi:HSP90 family molecular chaperone
MHIMPCSSSLLSSTPLFFHVSPQLEEAEKQYKDVLSFLKESLGERVEKVTVSTRLLDSPCALVTSKFGWSANMERIMKTQTMGDARQMEYLRGRKILEVNPQHDIVRGMKVSRLSAEAGFGDKCVCV